MSHCQYVLWVCFLHISTSFFQTVSLLCTEKLSFSMWLSFRHVLWLRQIKYHKMNTVWVLHESFVHVLSQKFAFKRKELLLCTFEVISLTQFITYFIACNETVGKWFFVQVGSGKLRPKPIQDIKIEDQAFINLYSLCWHQDPTSRPPICSVIYELQNIAASFNTPSNKTCVSENIWIYICDATCGHFFFFYQGWFLTLYVVIQYMYSSFQIRFYYKK